MTAWALIIKKEDYEYQKQYGGEKNRIASKLANNSIRLEQIEYKAKQDYAEYTLFDKYLCIKVGIPSATTYSNTVISDAACIRDMIFFSQEGFKAEADILTDDYYAPAKQPSNPFHESISKE